MISFLFPIFILSQLHVILFIESVNSSTVHSPHQERKRPGNVSSKHQIKQQRRRIQEEQNSSYPSIHPSLTPSVHPIGSWSNTHSASQKLRQDLLDGYDKGAFPWEYAWNASTTAGLREGLAVEFGINFHKVFNVDISLSVADLIVWVRQQWIDPRLVWDPLQYDGLENAYFWIGDGSGSGGETSEIWSPDLQLWNQESPLSDSLTDIHALVKPDGTVFWSRPGHIKPACKFAGLDSFPFDTLACTIEIGSWAYSGLYIRPTKYGGTGVDIGGGETSGEAFAEYSLKTALVEHHTYPPFPSSPEEDWPVLFYHVTFERAWQPYTRGYVLVQIVLNLIGFACFWLPPHCGERMGLAITAMLAAVASELVISGSLPQTSEMTWFSLFSLGSTLFAAFTLFESVIVIYLHYLTVDDLTPSYIKWFRKKRSFASKKDLDIPDIPDYNSNESDETDEPSSQNQISQENSGRQNISGSSGTHIKLFKKERSFVLEKDLGSPDIPVYSKDDTNDFNSIESDETDKPDNPNQIRQDNSKRRNNFGLSGTLDPHNVPVLSKTLVSFSDKKVKESNNEREKFTRQKSSGRRSQFSNARDADDFKSVRERNNNLRWQEFSRSIDEGARVLFPATFVIFLAVMLNWNGKSVGINA